MSLRKKYLELKGDQDLFSKVLVASNFQKEICQAVRNQEIKSLENQDFQKEIIKSQQSKNIFLT